MKEVIRGASRAREWLKKNGLPYSDEIPLICSDKEFPDRAGHYGIDVPVVNSLRVLEPIIQALKKEGIETVRFDETLGSFLLSDNEIKEMLAACAENGHGMTFSIGPRPEYDRKASFYRTSFGLEQGRTLNNNDAIAHAIEDALKLVDLGCRGIIVYDLGILRILNKMRASGVIPKDTFFLISTHCMVVNSIIAEVYAENGADNIVTLHDLGLPVIQEMRKVLPENVSLSIPIDMYKTKGGFIRYYEIPELIQIASPMFLKLGASAQSGPYDAVSQDTIRRRIDCIYIALDHLRKSFAEAKLLNKQSPHWLIPKRNLI